MTRDWRAWHTAYDHDTPLRARLAEVRRLVRVALDAAPVGPVRVLSMCAGEGRDLLGALDGHPRAYDVRARLVELDPELAGQAASRAPAGVQVVCGDASSTTAYEGAVPADLVLVCGVFGNIADADIEATIETLPSLCDSGAHVLWTRHRRAPDRTVDIRRWLSESGFELRSFVSPTPSVGVGLHRFVGTPAPFAPGVQMFTFVGYDNLC